MTKSLSRAKWALVLAIKSTMGVTCSTRERGNSSDIHKLALNLARREPSGQPPCLVLTG